MGEKFEDIERKQFGKDGFEDAVARIGRIEQALGLADLAQFTAPPPPKTFPVQVATRHAHGGINLFWTCSGSSFGSGLQRKWLDEAAYTDIIALCQLLPGQASSQVCIIPGMLRAELPALLAHGSALPCPRHWRSSLSPTGVGSLGEVSNAAWLHGLKIVAVAVVAQAGWNMARSLCPDRERVTLAVAATMFTLAIP